MNKKINEIKELIIKKWKEQLKEFNLFMAGISTALAILVGGLLGLAFQLFKKIKNKLNTKNN